ncbi:phage tail protein I [Brucella anthropi]|uniref:phage tail protein I n=1 Tax=Brucella anthropi TaxID=529 RepID=UPI00244A62E8|nr:phage tail protein I [Brucella anthropi]MDG9791985.1 phage tail protein I [Brucella anthropi]MDH0583430.1 phage tail protein I [Brucella anthropi]MDH0818201.1 phage tail protein I [Brucella anthropi]MDH2085421.1 phage tail protein I [Brucella anthropi]
MTAAQAIDAVADLARSILPARSSPLTVALLAAELARIATVDPTVIATIWNPETCPKVLLPYLAMGVSVDVWSADWSEEQQRRVIAASPMVHRLKGTRGAVERALAAFDLETKIIEWWEDGSRRGTFRVEILYRNGGPVFDLDTQADAIASVDAAKPKSRVFTTRAVLQAQGSLYIAAIARSHLTAIAHPFAFAPPVLEASSFIGIAPCAFIAATAHYKV